MAMQLSELFIPAAQAHEKWFVTLPTTPTPTTYHVLNAATLSAAAVIVAILALARWYVPRYAKTRLSPLLDRAAKWCAPFAADLFGAFMGAFLIWTSLHGRLLADNLVIPGGPSGQVIAGAEFAVGLLLLSGVYSRIAGIGLGALYAAAFFLNPWGDVIDYVYLVGVAYYFISVPRGPIWLDRHLGRNADSDPAALQRALKTLRLLLGANLLILALPKYLTPQMHLAMLTAFPDFNPYVVLQAVGFDWLSKEAYVFMIFVGEFTAGLLVISGWLLRPLSLVLMPLFAVSIIFLGLEDIIGHFPIILAIFVLFAQMQKAPAKA